MTLAVKILHCYNTQCFFLLTVRPYIAFSADYTEERHAFPKYNPRKVETFRM
jgi:hypothetical protein